jgi:hypothetical protein
MYVFLKQHLTDEMNSGLSVETGSIAAVAGDREASAHWRISFNNG